MLTFAAQLPLFRAYDIRGARQYFTPEFVTALGEAFALLYKAQAHHLESSNLKSSYVKENDCAHKHHQIYKNKTQTNTVVIGYDVRCDSDTIAQMLANRLRQHGLTVIQLDLITTPMMAFWAQQYDGHGIMVTASHSEKHILGVKWLVDGESPSEVDIQAVYKSLTHIKPTAIFSFDYNNSNQSGNTQTALLKVEKRCEPAGSLINLPDDIVASTYINAVAQVFARIEQRESQVGVNTSKPTTKLDLKIVIDCLHGATSRIAQPLFERFCKKVIVLNDIPDGSFPTGNPDPTEPNRLAELQQTVIINDADMGLAFDGDGDRLMIVDNSGKVVTPDHLLYLLAQVAITERPLPNGGTQSPQVLFDVKCSHHLPRLIEKLDATPVMSKTGSSLLRRQLHSYDSQAIFAGELSGHFIFNDGYFIIYDDAMYAGLRLLHWLASTVIKPEVTALLGIDINIHTEKSICTNPINNDVWGTRRRALLPYRLTDITQHLPKLVSTADKYLPLHDNASSSCSIVDHLIVFCHYLQHLVESSSAELPSKSAATLPSCRCFDSMQQMTTTQAKRLLPKGTLLTSIDGVRLDFKRGFGVLRQSNTSHSLTVRFAGDNLIDMREVQARFVALCSSFDIQIAEQIAAICPE